MPSQQKAQRGVKESWQSERDHTHPEPLPMGLRRPVSQWPPNQSGIQSPKLVGMATDSSSWLHKLRLHSRDHIAGREQSTQSTKRRELRNAC